MPRRVQDIVPNDRRSIRDVVLPKTKDIDSTRERVPLERKSSRIKDEVVLKIHKKNSVSEDKETLEKKEQMRRVVMTPSQRKKNSFKKKGLPIAILSVVVVIILAGFIASRYFSRAVFTITPKVFPVAVSNTLVIKPGVTADLSYDVITMKTSQSVTVSAIDGQVFSAKAEGTVNVYNAFSTSSVRLIAGTRLSGDSGLIYRLKSSIVIPGYTKSDGSIVAGKMATPIIAD
ncbi:MAG: hypothetical protein WCK03_03620, partial [Candidatus Taylorbacteria bacterium]